MKRSSDVKEQAALDGLRKELDTMAPRVKQVIGRAKARVLGGDTHVVGKLVSIFECRWWRKTGPFWRVKRSTRT